jgi:hypothetical protein
MTFIILILVETDLLRLSNKRFLGALADSKLLIYQQVHSLIRFKSIFTTFVEIT